jgi:uncharacterized membrane protein
MDDYLRNFAVALPIFILIDFTWIGVIAKKFYLDELGGLARTRDGKFTPNLPAGILAWAVIVAGIVLLAVPRLTSDSGVPTVLGWGALFGFIGYAMYDLTNLATVRDYSVKLTVVDIIWGTVLSSVVTMVVWLVAK